MSPDDSLIFSFFTCHTDASYEPTIDIYRHLLPDQREKDQRDLDETLQPEK
jgi:hypothetical protein